MMKENKKNVETVKVEEEVEMTMISVEELNMLRAEHETMKLTIRNLEWELNSKCQKLETTDNMLNEMVIRLSETRDLLHASLKKQICYKNVADGCLMTIKDFLMKWLTTRNRIAIDKALNFQKEEAQMRLITALLTYLIFGKKFETKDEVENRLYTTMVERIEKDSNSLPAHSMMVKLFKRHGLFQKLQEE